MLVMMCFYIMIILQCCRGADGTTMYARCTVASSGLKKLYDNEFLVRQGLTLEKHETCIGNVNGRVIRQRDAIYDPWERLVQN